jgi:pilus assembly protein Flp/PilA
VSFSQYEGEEIMRKLVERVKNFLAREDGPTAVEYAVMLALIIVVCITAITALGTNANKTFTSVGNSIGATSS